MASELGVVIKLSAVAGGIASVFSGVTGTVKKLGSAAEQLSAKQKKLGDDIQKYAGTLSARSVASLAREYDQLGKAIERVKVRQDRLAAWQAKGEQFKKMRDEARGQFVETLALGAAVAYPVKQAVDFQAAMSQVRRAAKFESQDGFRRLGDDILDLSERIPVAAGSLAELAAIGAQARLPENKLLGFTNAAGEMSRAWNLSTAETGDALVGLSDAFQRPLDQIGQLGDAITHLAKETPAKARDIVGMMREIGAGAKKFGLTDVQTGALSAGMLSMGAENAKKASSAIGDLLEKMGSADKQSDAFKKGLRNLGIDARDMKKLVGQDAEGALLSFLVRLKEAPEKVRISALNEMFGGEHASNIALLTGALNEYTGTMAAVQRRNKDGGLAYEGSTRRGNKNDDDIVRDNLVKLGNSATRLGVAIGITVLPAVNEFIAEMQPLLKGLSAWTQAHLGLVSGLIKGALALATFRLGLLGSRYVFGVVGGGVSGLMKTVELLGGKFTLLRAMSQAGASRLPMLLQLFGMGAEKSALWAGRLGTLGGWISKAGGFLGGKLVSGLRLAGQALLWVGRIAMANPIGLLIGGIALGAFLIYKYWGPIQGFFRRWWGELRTAFSGGIGGISRFILDWSPLGLFYRSFASVLSWFGIDLPEKFSDFGSMLIDGLVSGITARFSEARTAIVNFGNNIRLWFSETLGIQSPSRVFIGLGENIGAGAAIGIDRSGAQAARAAAALAGTTASSAQGSVGAASSGRGFGGGITVHFAPQYTVQGGNGDVGTALADVARMSLADLERLFSRLLAQQARRAN